MNQNSHPFTCHFRLNRRAKNSRKNALILVRGPFGKGAAAEQTGGEQSLRRAVVLVVVAAAVVVVLVLVVALGEVAVVLVVALAVVLSRGCLVCTSFLHRTQNHYKNR